MIRLRLVEWEKVLFAVVVAIVLYVVAVPLVLLLFGATTDGPPGTHAKFTLANVINVTTNPQAYAALGNTLVFALSSSTLALLLGSFTAWVTQRTNTPGRTLIFFGALFPLFVPTVIMTMSWTYMLRPRAGLFNEILKNWLHVTQPVFNVYSLGGMIFVDALMSAPLAFLWMWPAFRAMDQTLEEAAFTSGAGLARTLFQVTLPLTTPSLLAAWLILFVTSVEGLAIPLFIGLPGKVFVLATEIYLATARSPTNVNLGSAYALLLLAITLIGVVLYRRATAQEGRYATLTGRGYRLQVLDLGRWRYATCAFGLVVVCLTGLLPMLVVAWNSLLPFPQMISREALSMVSLANFQALSALPVPRRALFNSAYLGLASGVLVTAFAAVTAWLVVRSRLRGRGALDFAATAPIAIPGIVIGLSLLWVYLTLPIPIYGTAWILIVAYFTRFLPYGVRIAYSALGQLHPELEEAAWTCGATWWRTFRVVTVPLLAPGLAVAAVYIMLRAFRELSASVMLVHYGSEVFSVAVYDLWSGGAAGTVFAYALVTVALMGTLVALLHRTATRFGIQP